jgi:hypothetical protein
MSPRPAGTLRRRNGPRARALADTQQGRRQQPRPRAAEIVLALWQAPAGARKLNRLLPLLTDEMTIGEHDRPARRATVTSPDHCSASVTGLVP